jgi:hypothetical protein
MPSLAGMWRGSRASSLAWTRTVRPPLTWEYAPCAVRTFHGHGSSGWIQIHRRDGVLRPVRQWASDPDRAIGVEISAFSELIDTDSWQQ